MSRRGRKPAANRAELDASAAAACARAGSTSASSAAAAGQPQLGLLLDRARDPAPLVVAGGHEPPRRGLELRHARRDLAVQARVAERGSRGRGRGALERSVGEGRGVVNQGGHAARRRRDQGGASVRFSSAGSSTGRPASSTHPSPER